MGRNNSKFINTLRGAAQGEFLLNNISYTAFLALLGLVYIANSHFSERKTRNIRLLEKELKEVRWEFVSIETSRMYNSKQDELAESVKEYGLTLDRKRLKKIVIQKK